MGRSHKKGGGGGGSSGKKKKQQHHKRKQQQAATSRTEADSPDTTGWTQEDFQHREQARLRDMERTGSGNVEPVPTPLAPPSRSVSGSRKKRKHTPSWMIDPDDPPAGYAADPAAATSASAGASSSSVAPSLTSACWNSLPRDCVLHVFSFFDLFAIARLTGTNHWWYSCLRRGVMARVLEQSWRILRQKPVQQLTLANAGSRTPKESSDGASATSTPAAAAAVATQGWRSLSDTISPAMLPSPPVQSLDSEESAPTATAARSALTPAVSPSLSALPPAAALQAMSALALPASAAASSASSLSFSIPAPSSFRFSVLHLRSLYAGQKNLAYSLLSNPLWQHLQVLYHLSWCHERVIEVVAQMHSVLFRAKHKGKWPRSTKKEAATGAFSAAAATSTADLAASSAPDLMPLHLVLDSAVMHRASFLSCLQRSPHKHLHDFLHARPVITHFGFDGNSLPRVQMQRLLRSMEAKLERSLVHPTAEAAGAASKQSSKAPSATPKGRYHSNPRAVPPSPSDFVLDPATGAVLLSHPADLPCNFVPHASGSASGFGSTGLVTSAEAEAVAAMLRRMERLAEIWGKSLHSNSTIAQTPLQQRSPNTTEGVEAAAANRPAADIPSSAAAAAASSSSSTLKSSSSALDREWDELASLWLSQHQRLRLLHAFWSRLAQLLHERERQSLMNEIVAAASSVPGVAVQLSHDSPMASIMAEE